jgi:hypothetical protein
VPTDQGLPTILDPTISTPTDLDRTDLDPSPDWDLCGACQRLVSAAGAKGATVDTILAALPRGLSDRAAVVAALRELEGNFDVYLRDGAYLPM